MADNNSSFDLGEDVISILEENDIRVHGVTQYATGEFQVEMSFYSRAGEDFLFYVECESEDKFKDAFCAYAEDFDKDEHIREVMDINGAPSISELVEDADYIQNVLTEASNALYGEEIVRAVLPVSVTIDGEKLARMNDNNILQHIDDEEEVQIVVDKLMDSAINERIKEREIEEQELNKGVGIEIPDLPLSQSSDMRLLIDGAAIDKLKEAGLLNDTSNMREVSKEVSKLLGFAADTVLERQAEAVLNAEMTEKIENIIKETVNNFTYGKGTYNIYPSRSDDALSSQFVLDAINDYQELVAESGESKDTGCTFKQYFDQRFYEMMALDWDVEAENELFGAIETAIGKEDFKVQMAYLEYREGKDSYEILEDGGYKGIDYDLNDWLQNEYNFNLMFATPAEQNYDMGNIQGMFPAIDDFSDKYLEGQLSRAAESTDNALTYLIHQQGHTVQELYDVVYGEQPSDSKLLNSIAEEITNANMGMNELTACVAIDGKEMLEVFEKIAKGEGSLQLSEKTTIGIFNEWDGSGGTFDIELEKPFVIPTDMIRNIQVEGSDSRDTVRGNSGYTVDGTYGFVRDVWTSGEMSIKDPPEQESVADIQSKLKSYAEKELRGKNQSDVNRE